VASNTGVVASCGAVLVDATFSVVVLSVVEFSVVELSGVVLGGGVDDCGRSLGSSVGEIQSMMPPTAGGSPHYEGRW
jgi:hypothetical protein